MSKEDANNASNGILRSLEATVGPDLVRRIQTSRLLLVGAGGIGCELLKNLALTGFRNVEVIDMDTIDVSNLNRQLLFRSHHVGQSKCQVACQVATGMALLDDNDDNDATGVVSYKAHHGNVCDNSQFNVQYVKQFDLILNALDNVVARRRVNRLALAAGTPLIEAGTTGYLGQVATIHRPSQTACYECQTQETAKVYPICTIRSTPSAPVHCIVWAKELYKLLFDPKVEESMLYEGDDGVAASESPEDGAKRNGEETTGTEETSTTSSTYMPAVTAFRALMMGVQSPGRDSASLQDESVASTATTLLRNLYVDEVQKQLDMDRYKTAQKKPLVLSDDVIRASTAVNGPTSLKDWNPQEVWTPTQCAAEWITCLRDAVLRNNNNNDNVDDIVLPSFDKDDALCMRFVTAASSLRSTVFGIPPQSFYAAKGIAGNIIPAISTTNAIVAGLQILQCFQILKAQLSLQQQQQQQQKSNDDSKHSSVPEELTNLRQYCRYVNCVRNATRNGLYLMAGALEGPNPRCFVCRKATVPLHLNVHNWTLKDLLERIVKKDLGFEQPSITMDESGDYIWEEGDDAEDFSINLAKKLPDLPCGGIRHGTVIAIEDFTQDLTVQVVVTHVDHWPVTEEEPVPDALKFVVGGAAGGIPKPIPADSKSGPVAAAAATASGDTKPTATTNTDDDDDVEIVSDPNDAPTRNRGSKRAAEEMNGISPRAKKSKPDSVEVIEIDDD